MRTAIKVFKVAYKILFNKLGGKKQISRNHEGRAVRKPIEIYLLGGKQWGN